MKYAENILIIGGLSSPRGSLTCLWVRDHALDYYVWMKHFSKSFVWKNMKGVFSQSQSISSF